MHVKTTHHTVTLEFSIYSRRLRQVQEYDCYKKKIKLYSAHHRSDIPMTVRGAIQNKLCETLLLILLFLCARPRAHSHFLTCNELIKTIKKKNTNEKRNDFSTAQNVY